MVHLFREVLPQILLPAIFLAASSGGTHASPYLLAHSDALYGNYQSTFYFDGRTPVQIDPNTLTMLSAYVPNGYVLVDMGANVISEVQVGNLHTQVLAERGSEWGNIVDVISDQETVLLFDFGSMLENRMLSWSFAAGTRYWININRDWGSVAIAAPAFIDALIDTDGDGHIDFADSCADIFDSSNANYDGDNLGNACDSDDDNDQLPDSWEELYGLNSLDEDDATGDLDGDGISNRDEFNNATDPSVALGSGDVNQDNAVDIADVLLVERHLIGVLTLTNSQIHAGDAHPSLTGDNVLGLGDLLVLQRRLLSP